MAGKLSKNELECIQSSRLAKLEHQKRKLEEYYPRLLPQYAPEMTFSDLYQLDIDWKPTIQGKLLQIALIPLIWLFVLCVIVISPLMYCLEIWPYLKQKHQCKQAIKTLSQESTINSSDECNPEKTLDSLWNKYGLSTRHHDQESLELLKKWIEILYPKGTVELLAIDARVEAIQKAQIEANAGYYRGEPDAAHFYFVPPIDCVITEILERLPPYNDVEN